MPPPPSMFALRQRAKAINMRWYSRMNRATLTRYLDAYEESSNNLYDNVDAITQDTLRWPWFELHPTGAGGGSAATEHKTHGFDPCVLARFFVKTDRFINPRTLQHVTNDDMCRLDTMLRETRNTGLAHNVELFASIDTRARARKEHADATMLFERELDSILFDSILRAQTLSVFSYACFVIATQFLPTYCDTMICFLGHDLESACIKLRLHRDHVCTCLQNVVSNITANACCAVFPEHPSRFVFTANVYGAGATGTTATGHLGSEAFRCALICGSMLATLDIFTQYVSNVVTTEPMSDDLGRFASESVQEHWQRGILTIFDTASSPMDLPSPHFDTSRSNLSHDITIALHRHA